MPETFLVAEQLKERAFAANQWHSYTPVLLTQPQESDLYQISEIEEELEAMSKKLGKQEIACEPDAQKQLMDWMEQVR